MDLPAEFIDTIRGVFGDAGRDWVRGLPDLVVRCRAKWGLSGCVMSNNLSFSYVEFATNDAGEAMVLKVGVPDKEFLTGLEALRLYGGRRAVRLVDAAPQLGAMLMERVRPGTMLWQVGDNLTQSRIAGTLMRELPIAVPAAHGFPTFAQWTERAFRLTRTQWDPEELMPRDLLDRAEQAFAELSEGSSGDVLLHGDLHHENILLDDASGWVAIDPKGVIGPHPLEAGRFLHNQLERVPSSDIAEIVSQRLEALSEELELERATLAASGLVDCVLAHCWCFEMNVAPGPKWRRGIEVVRTFADLL